MTIAEYIEVLKTLPQDAAVKQLKPVCGYMSGRDDVCEDEALKSYDSDMNEYVL